MRGENFNLQETFVMPFRHDETTADVAKTLYEFARRARITRVSYVSDGGLADDASNFADVRVKSGSVVLANWSTQTGQQGDLPDNESVEMILAADTTTLVLDAGEALTLDVNASGTVTLPPGMVSIEGVFI
jgi:hypothetical protein